MRTSWTCLWTWSRTPRSLTASGKPWCTVPHHVLAGCDGPMEAAWLTVGLGDSIVTGGSIPNVHMCRHLGARCLTSTCLSINSLLATDKLFESKRKLLVGTVCLCLLINLPSNPSLRFLGPNVPCGRSILFPTVKDISEAFFISPGVWFFKSDLVPCRGSESISFVAQRLQ